ncbi:MAG: oligosaccharide flippase family protein [Clostridiales bacterium]|nr:oligosaccharide flippase family protein [Clostridiales bacterium]
MKYKKDSLVYNTFLLTLANFFIRIMGFVYRIVISRLAGAETMGLMQMMMPLYSTFIGIVASGIPIALTRIITTYRTKGDYRAIKNTITSAFIGISTLSSLLFVIFILNINLFSSRLLSNNMTKIPLMLLSPCIIIISIKAIFRGYFHGMKKIHIPAMANIFEQIIRIGLIFALFYYIAPNDIESSAHLIVIGMVIGELASLLFLHVNFYKHSAFIRTYDSSCNVHGTTLKSIGKIALPITSTRVILSIASSIRAAVVPRQFMLMGMTSKEALNSFGIIGSMVVPLFFIPFIIINGLGTILIPNISEDVAAKRWDSIRNKISKAIAITCVTAFFSSTILKSLGGHIGVFLFKEPDVGKYLTPSAPFLVLLCLHQTLSSIMNGLGLERDCAGNNIIGAVVELIALYIFIPIKGVFGYIISFYLGSAVAAFLHYISIYKKTSLSFNIAKWVLGPVFSTFITGLCIKIILMKLLLSSMASYFIILLPTIVGFFVFLSVLWAVNVAIDKLIQSWIYR